MGPNSEFPEFEKLCVIIAKLLDPKDGCPWDLEQTHQSLLQYLIEETFEFVHAVELNDMSKMEEEIGDVLLQVLLHSQIASKSKEFSLESVAKTLAEKMVRRHPHVFGKIPNTISHEEIKKNWNHIKRKEKGDEYKIHINETFLPSLYAAYKIGKKTKELNFDWEGYQQVVYKVEEEWQELKEELPPNGHFNKERVKEELGDLLFSVAQLARHLELEPEEVLRSANKKFVRRFNQLEDLANCENLEIGKCPQETMDQLWSLVKKKENERAT